MTRLQWIAPIGVFCVFLLILYLLSNFKFVLDVFQEALVRNLGSYKIAIITLIGISLLFLALLILGFFYMVNKIDVHLFNSERRNVWGLAMILTMLFVFLYGVIAYDTLYGQEKISLILRNESGHPAGTLDCKSSGQIKVILEGQGVFCNISNSGKIIGGYVNQKLKNSSIISQDFNDSIHFTSVKDVDNIYFLIKIQQDLKSYNLSTGNKYYFPTQDEYQDLGIKFIKFLILLLGVIFITIPTSFYYMREIFTR